MGCPPCMTQGADHTHSSTPEPGMEGTATALRSFLCRACQWKAWKESIGTKKKTHQKKKLTQK